MLDEQRMPNRPLLQVSTVRQVRGGAPAGVGSADGV